jgi:hypothetical protein
MRCLSRYCYVIRVEAAREQGVQPSELAIMPWEAVLTAVDAQTQHASANMRGARFDWRV